MVDMKGKLLPGTAATYVIHGEKGFTKIDMLLEATGGLTLSQVCAVTGLEGSTIQNWVKRGWVAHPKGKKYEEEHIARILIINALKECIKLEQIAQLMIYVNGETEAQGDDIIRESRLFNYLCDALQRLEQADDLSKGGVEMIVETIIKDYSGTVPHARARIRKALAVMIYACVCTDVKRRTEAMMEQVLRELENPDMIEDDDVFETFAGSEAETAAVEMREDPAKHAAETAVEVKKPEETKKTVAQALREWDLNRVESVLAEHSVDTEETEALEARAQQESKAESAEGTAGKPAQKPYYFRRK